MIVSTAPALEDRRIVDHAGLVPGETTMHASTTGGQAGTCEKVLKDTRDVAVGEMSKRGGGPRRQRGGRRRPRLRGARGQSQYAHGVGQRDGGGGGVKGRARPFDAISRQAVVAGLLPGIYSRAMRSSKIWLDGP